jgi:glycosyltransferase involved in cell wall biosynthesis
MIYFSELKYSYDDFDWELYLNTYSNLKDDGYISKDQLWWHYVNIGEKKGYLFLNIHNKNKMAEKYELFDWKLYLEKNPELVNKGLITKENLWLHYINVGEISGLPFFSVNSNKKIVTNIITNKTIYYYIDHTCKDKIRTGIQVVSIFLAKALFLIKKNLDIIFVKWNNISNTLIPCDPEEINFFFNYNQPNTLLSPIKYLNYMPIHLNEERPLNNCLFFCPELTFILNLKIPLYLNTYLNKYKIKSIYILYDIIPMKLEEYKAINKGGFKSYIDYSLLFSNKIITISNFTKNEFLQYVNQNELYNIHFPIVTCVSLPYQYRDKKRIINNLIEREKIIILLPGTIEPRKQQIRLMKIFNKFIKKNPEIDVELITFGNIVPLCQNDFDNYVNESNGKIKYLGIIDNEKLFELYKMANFTCFISLYEGFGFPISESLWHGVPVLTSNFGSMKEVTSCGGCHSIDTKNENEIYEALNHLIINPLFIEKLKHEIYKSSLTTWKDYAEKIYTEIIEELK